MESRPIVLGAVSLLKGSVREVGPAMQDVMNLLEPLVHSSKFLTDAPFKKVQLIFRFGERTDLRVNYQRRSKDDPDLPVAVELELASLRLASRDVVRDALLAAAIAVIDDVATRFNLPRVNTATLER